MKTHHKAAILIMKNKQRTERKCSEQTRARHWKWLEAYAHSSEYGEHTEQLNINNQSQIVLSGKAM